MKDLNIAASISAFVVYITDGLAIFGGIAAVLLFGDADVHGWGKVKTLAYFSICTGSCLSILGVLIFRFLRNRPGFLSLRHSTKLQQRYPISSCK